MNKDLKKFIKESFALGKSRAEIKKILVSSGWAEKDVDEALGKFEKLTRFDKRGLFNFIKRQKKAFALGLAFLVLVAIVIVAWQIFFKKPVSPARFSLEAAVSDAGGTNPNTSFLLKSTQPLSEKVVAKILKFNPETDFNVKKLSQAPSFISYVFAQTSEGASGVFEISPAQPLEEDTVYQATINDPDYADHEYSWAFQIKAPFQVIQTHPRHQGTHIPINSGIEITFNRENLVTPENYFSIEPNVSGTFEQHANTLIFLPQGLAEKTVYTVTIKKGLKTRGSDDVLDQDYVFAFETGEQKYTGQQPYFNFKSEFLEFIPDKKATIEVYYYNLNPDNLEINVYKLPDIDEFLNSYQNSRQWHLGWTSYYKREAGSSYQPKENQKVLFFKPTVIKSGYQNFIEIPQVLEKGYYLLDVEVAGKHRQAWLQITPLAHYFSVTYEKGFLWMYDFQKKEPLVDSGVSFYDKAVGEASLGRTNQEGLIEFSTPETIKEDKRNFNDPKFFKLEKEGYLPLLIKISDIWGYRQKASKGDLYWDYLSTDRYTYQMNDSLRYWGVVKGRQEDLRQKKVTVGIYSGYYYGPAGDYSVGERQPLASREVLISQFDTIQGEFSFKGISPGYYNVLVTIGDEVVSSAYIEILTYAKPAYQIIVTPSERAVFAGEKVDFHVKANFFDGTPVPALQLKYNSYWRDSITGELTLDENGEGSLSYTPAYYESQYAYYPRSLQFTFSPKLSEEGEITGTGQVLVFGPKIYLQSFGEKQSGNTYKFTSKLNHIIIKENIQDESSYWRNEYIGNPVSDYPVSANIIKITYSKIETGQYYDPIDKVVRKKYRYERKEEVIERLSGKTDQAGEWSFVKSLPKETEATYRVTFFGQDSQGRKIESSSYAYYYYYGSWKEFAVSLNINDQQYHKDFSVGDKVELEVKISEGEPISNNILFYRYQNNISRVSIESGVRLEEAFTKEFLPSVQYRAVVLGPYGFEETDTVTASFKKEDNNLAIDIQSEKESYRPGQEVKINLTVADKDKKPVSAEVNVAVVDEALFHILPYNWQAKILESLYQRIYISPLTGFSQYALLPGEGAEGGGCFGAGTPILMIDGSSKPIEKVKVGDQILTLVDEKNTLLVPAIVQGISQHLVDEVLIINDSLRVTPEHKMFVNGAWKYASNIKLGDRLVGIDGSREEVYSVKRGQAPNTLVYNIIVNGYHTYFAGGYFVHNAEKGGIPRVNFVDVALYETVHSGKDGQASVSFVTPDNITAWRVTAIAFSPDSLKAGQNIKLIKISLPFFVDATLSKHYLVRDSPTLRLRVFGTDYKQNELTEFGIKGSSLNLDKKTSSDRNVVYLPLDQLTEGEHEIIVWAKQGRLEDSIARKIKVVKSYFRKAESSIYSLSASLSNIEGNQDGFTKLVFMDAGRGRFYRALWWHTYLSGIRADQVAASFFGEKLLADYFSEPAPTEQLDLSSYHTPEGGISLFPYSDNDLELSAKMADLAPEFVFQDKIKAYLNDALKDKKADIHRIAKALYGLASLREPVLTKINLVKGNKELNLEDKVYISLALAKIGDKENARKIYEDEIRGQLRFQGNEAWLVQEQDMTKRVKLTGTIGVLASYLSIEKDIAPLWDYIAGHDPERDLDVLEETLLMKSELARLKDQKAEFSYKTNSRSDSITLEKGRTYTLTLSAEELKTIRFSGIEGNIILVSFYERSRDPAELTKNNELNLTRKYFVGGRETKSLKEGDIILVKLDPKIASSAIDGSYQVVDYLPSGLKPITRLYERGLSGGTECDPVWYPAKIIDNTVYFNIYKGFNKTQYCSNRTLNYYARVVSQGSYTANPAIIQSLKDLDSLNISPKDTVEIR